MSLIYLGFRELWFSTRVETFLLLGGFRADLSGKKHETGCKRTQLLSFEQTFVDLLLSPSLFAAKCFQSAWQLADSASDAKAATEDRKRAAKIAPPAGLLVPDRESQRGPAWSADSGHERAF